MTKSQKIWLYLGLALFALPEILWSSASNLFYEYTQTGKTGGTHPYRANWLFDIDNVNALSIILFAQFLGLCAIGISLLKSGTRGRWIGVLPLLLAAVLLILFGLSVSIRSIGF